MPGASAVTTPQGVSTGKLWDFGGATWNVMSFGAIGDGTAHHLSERYASVAAAQVDYSFVTALTQCIDWAAGRAAAQSAYAAGGGIVLWPPGHYVSDTAADSIPMLPFVRHTGSGFASFLDFKNNVFFEDGMHPSNYDTTFTFRLANAVTAGDRTVTLQTAAQSADFVAPCLAVLRSVAEDAAGFPCFIELVKVIAVNAGTGVLTLEEALEDALADPEIGVSPYAITGNPIPEGGGLDWLRIKADYTAGSVPFRIRGHYKGKYAHLWLEGTQIITGNGYTRCTFEDIVGIAHTLSTGSQIPGVELKSGSYKSTVRNIKWMVLNEDGDASVKTLISTGERDREVTVEDFEVYSPSTLGFTRLIQEGTAIRGVFRNGRAVINGPSDLVVTLGASDNGAGSGHVLPTRRRVENVDVVVAGTFGCGLNATDSTNASEHNDVVRGFRIFGSPATVNGTGPFSIAFGATNGVYVYDSVVPGQYKANSGLAPLNCHLYNTLTDGPVDRTTRANVIEHNALWTNSANPPAPAQLFNSTVTNTTPNNPVATLNMPAHFPWVQGDKVKFRIAGSIAGVNNTKTIVIADPNGAAVYTLTVAAGTTGAFMIEGYFVETTVQNVDATMNMVTNVLSVQGATVASARFSSLTVPTNVTVPFQIQAWVTNASDSIVIAHAELQYVRVEDSLTFGATEARS